jgi:hypothetical protein
LLSKGNLGRQKTVLAPESYSIDGLVLGKNSPKDIEGRF